VLLAKMLLAELLLPLLGLLFLLLRLQLLPLLLDSSIHVLCQSLLNRRAGEEFRESCMSIASLGLSSAASLLDRLLHWIIC
jgi:hypothetical protein